MAAGKGDRGGAASRTRGVGSGARRAAPAPPPSRPAPEATPPGQSQPPLALLATPTAGSFRARAAGHALRPITPRPPLEVPPHVKRAEGRLSGWSRAAQLSAHGPGAVCVGSEAVGDSPGGSSSCWACPHVLSPQKSAPCGRLETWGVTLEGRLRAGTGAPARAPGGWQWLPGGRRGLSTHSEGA